MSRTVAELVAGYWGECARPEGRDGWCFTHESRWTNKTHQFCDEFLHISGFVEYLRTEVKP